MGAITSQITSITIVLSTVYLDTDQRKHQSSASLAFVRGIHRGPVNSPHKWPVTRKMFPVDDVIMYAKLLPLYSSPHCVDWYILYCALLWFIFKHSILTVFFAYAHMRQWGWVTKTSSDNLAVSEFFIYQMYLLNPINHVHNCQVSAQLSWGNWWSNTNPMYHW